VSTDVHDIYFTMVYRVDLGWVRVGRAYTSKEVAENWLGFVSSAWGGKPTEVSMFTVTSIDGVLDGESIRILDEKYNMDPPK